VATPVSPLAVTPSALYFVIDNAHPVDRSLEINITGGEAGLTWTAESYPNWMTVAPDSATSATPLKVTVPAGGIAPGTQDGTITLHFTGGGTNPDKTIQVTVYRGDVLRMFMPAIRR